MLSSPHFTVEVAEEEGAGLLGSYSLGSFSPEVLNSKPHSLLAERGRQEKALFSPGVCSLNFNYSLLSAQEGH